MIGGDGINDESNKTAPPPTVDANLQKHTRVLRHPYTAMRKSAWTPGMPRAGASRLAAMRLTGPDPDMRQPRGVTDPQSGEAASTPRTGPTLKRSSNSST